MRFSKAGRELQRAWLLQNAVVYQNVYLNTMKLRHLVTRPMKWVLAKAGWDVVKTYPGWDLIQRDRYGYDPFLDIERLSRLWKYSVRVFFDVGANDGATIRWAKSAFPNCRVVAFEPHPETFLRLKENMRSFENLELVNMALGDKTAEVQMFEYDESVLNSLLPNAPFAVRFSKTPREIKVPCTTVDKFCAENGIAKIDVLKIDTEGFDLQVLNGASSMLKDNSINFIYFEFNDIQQNEGTQGGALVPIDKFIRPFGYQFIAAYNDAIEPHDDVFTISNALYALPPAAKAGSD